MTFESIIYNVKIKWRQCIKSLWEFRISLSSLQQILDLTHETCRNISIIKSNETRMTLQMLVVFYMNCLFFKLDPL